VVETTPPDSANTAAMAVTGQTSSPADEYGRHRAAHLRRGPYRPDRASGERSPDERRSTLRYAIPKRTEQHRFRLLEVCRLEHPLVPPTHFDALPVRAAAAGPRVETRPRIPERTRSRADTPHASRPAGSTQLMALRAPRRAVNRIDPWDNPALLRGAQSRVRRDCSGGRPRVVTG
jgi:hypothetical protein